MKPDNVIRLMAGSFVLISVALTYFVSPWGLVLGLFVGKPVGVFAASWLAVRLGISSLPSGVTWKQMFGAGMMAGIGFTMSLFIGTLAFGEGSPMLDGAKLAILAASLMAGVVGMAFLFAVSPKNAEAPQAAHSHGH